MRKELFHVLGKAVIIDEKKRFVPYSPAYLNQKIASLPLDKELELKFSVHRATRSAQQLKYHMVLANLIGQHTGLSDNDAHAAILTLKYGLKTVKLGSRTTQIRRSVADNANMDMADMAEVIEFDHELCNDLEIRVPTPEELGYFVDTNGKIIK